MTERLADIDFESIEHRTEKATLFIIDGKEQWIPNSISEIDEKEKQVTVPYQFAFKNGLI